MLWSGESPKGPEERPGASTKGRGSADSGDDDAPAAKEFSKLVNIPEMQQRELSDLLHRNAERLSDDGDSRHRFGLVPMDKIEEQFAKEFEEADARIQRKVAERNDSWFYYLFVDPDQEAMYEGYRDYERRVKDTHQIHFVDELLDQTTTLVRYLGRGGTTLGLLYGAYRTRFLWRTIDKAYARMNGVRLGDIAIMECAKGVLKGMAVSAGAGIGGVLAEQAYFLASAFCADTPALPQRDWRSITVAGVGMGAGGGGLFAALNWQLFTPRACAFVTIVPTALSTAAGLYVGKAIYQPFADARGHRHDTNPRARPWNERLVTVDGDRRRHIRGRYV